MKYIFSVAKNQIPPLLSKYMIKFLIEKSCVCEGVDFE